MSEVRTERNLPHRGFSYFCLVSRDSEPNRGWYAHGTVYLLSRRRTSHRLGDPSRMWNRERNKPIGYSLLSSTQGLTAAGWRTTRAGTGEELAFRTEPAAARDLDLPKALGACRVGSWKPCSSCGPAGPNVMFAELGTSLP